jgi:hypothetical protein
MDGEVHHGGIGEMNVIGGPKGRRRRGSILFCINLVTAMVTILMTAILYSLAHPVHGKGGCGTMSGSRKAGGRTQDLSIVWEEVCQ